MRAPPPHLVMEDANFQLTHGLAFDVDGSWLLLIVCEVTAHCLDTRACAQTPAGVNVSVVVTC
jgi:hypothetical protein